MNWGRSVIESHDPQTAKAHIQAARHAGVLSGLMFSGCSPHETDFGYPWIDAHLPAQEIQDAPKSSLFNKHQISRCLEAAGSPAIVGFEIGLPTAATAKQRARRLRHCAGSSQPDEPEPVMTESAKWTTRHPPPTTTKPVARVHRPRRSCAPTSGSYYPRIMHGIKGHKSTDCDQARRAPRRGAGFRRAASVRVCAGDATPPGRIAAVPEAEPQSATPAAPIWRSSQSDSRRSLWDPFPGQTTG